MRQHVIRPPNLAAATQELSEQIVRRLAELDALHADRCEADKRANDAETKAAQMRRALASLTPEVSQPQPRLTMQWA